MLVLASARRRIFMAALTLALPAAGACTSTSSSGTSSGGPVTGAMDMHCTGMASQPISQPDCHVTTVPDAGGGGGGGGGTGGSVSDYGPTMYNAEGDDDDCKYHVSWTSTAIAENKDVTFTVSAHYKATGVPNPPACSGCPVDGLDTTNTLIDAFLSDTHPAPNTTQVVTSRAAGTYSIGPVRFDAPGQWTVRFHFFELCADVLDDSPHGHAAFYVDVP